VTHGKVVNPDGRVIGLIPLGNPGQEDFPNPRINTAGAEFGLRGADIGVNGTWQEEVREDVRPPNPYGRNTKRDEEQQ